MFEKTARTPSGDPVQEKLRQDKSNWNKEVSSFINDLIHLKKTMNGWPSKFFKERSRITQPIPADPTTIIGSLAGDFQQLAQRGESIVQEQLNYSKNRRQKQPKQPKPAARAPQTPATPEAPAPSTPSAPAPDLSKQLAAWEQKYGEELVAEGSSKLTRTFTRLVNPTIGFGSGTKRRRHRMNMLKRAAKVYKLLGKMQVKIVAPLASKQSIKDAYELLRTIKAEWSLVEESLQFYKSVAGEEVSQDDSKKESPQEEKKLEQAEEVAEQQKQAPAPPAPNDTEVVALAENVKNDYISVLKGKIGLDAANTLGAVMNSFMKEPGPAKIDIARQLVQQYTSLLAALQTKYGVAGNTLGQIEAAITAKEQAAPKTASTQIEVVAQDFLKRWVGKTRHSVIPGDTSDYRVNIFDMAKDLRDEVNVFMDLAESRKTLVPQYEEQAKKIGTDIHKMDSHMMKLYRLYFRVPKEMQGLI